jgi:predicted patatin/cPLA2 family phospholipase
MLSVAIQGGAMRSVYCFGAARALIDRGLAGEIGSVHTASAGCVAGALLTADPDGPSATEMRTRLIEQLAGDRFINPRRLKKVLDVDLLVQAMNEVTGIGAASLKRRGVVFEVCMTDAQTGAPRYVDLSACADDDAVMKALRATMAVPALYPRQITYDGRRYIDGGVSDPLPLLRAVQRDPAVVITIASVATGHLGWELEGYEPLVVRLAPGVLSGQVKHLLLARNPLAATVESLSALPSLAGVRLLRIAPTDMQAMGSRLETDRDKLLALEELGYQDALQALDGFTPL